MSAISKSTKTIKAAKASTSSSAKKGAAKKAAPATPAATEKPKLAIVPPSIEAVKGAAAAKVAEKSAAKTASKKAAAKKDAPVRAETRATRARNIEKHGAFACITDEALRNTLGYRVATLADGGMAVDEAMCRVFLGAFRNDDTRPACVKTYLRTQDLTKFAPRSVVGTKGKKSDAGEKEPWQFAGLTIMQVGVKQAVHNLTRMHEDSVKNNHPAERQAWYAKARAYAEGKLAEQSA